MIGIFDSGIGGLSIWREIVSLDPAVSTLYVADQAWIPYGSQPQSVISRRSHLISHYLIDQGATLIVVACTTATVTATISDLRHHFPNHQFVGVEPPVKLLSNLSQTRHTALFATPATTSSLRLHQLVNEFTSNLDILVVPTPEFVEIIEANFPEPATTETLHRYVDPLLATSIDFLGLGCTHYSFLTDRLQFFWPSVTIVDVASPVARQVFRLYQPPVFSSLFSHRFFTTSPDTSSLRLALQNLLSVQTPVECVHI